MEYSIQNKQNPQSGWYIGKYEEISEAITREKEMDDLPGIDEYSREIIIHYM